MDWQALFENFRRTVSEHFFDLHGRVGRAQFWYFVLVDFLFGLVAAILQTAIALPLAALYNLVMLFPVTGMCARRLQDTGRDGRLVWIFLIAGFVSQIASVMAAVAFATTGFFGLFLFGPIAVLINIAFLVALLAIIWFCIQPGNPGDNAYGPPPPVFDPSKSPSPIV
ncbi:MAG TPA: DUF805 domain-containing protein [Rhizomicrobium sp.]